MGVGLSSTTGIQITLSRLNRTVINTEAGTVSVGMSIHASSYKKDPLMDL